MVSAFPTHDTVEHDSRFVLPNGESYRDFKRKYPQQHCKEEYANAKDPELEYWKGDGRIDSGSGGHLNLASCKKWPPPRLNLPDKQPIREWVVLTSRDLDEHVPYYNEKGLVEDDRHCVISPFGMLSREEKNYKQFRTDSLDRVRIPDQWGHHTSPPSRFLSRRS